MSLKELLFLSVPRLVCRFGTRDISAVCMCRTSSAYLMCSGKPGLTARRIGIKKNSELTHEHLATVGWWRTSLRTIELSK
jgi:hypothetical protein